jgi:hypothetical protein
LEEEMDMKTQHNLLMLSAVLTILMMGLLSNPLVYSSTFNAPFLVEIDSVAVNDSYARFHALTFDNPIPKVFWSAGDWYHENEDAMIGIRTGSLHYETMAYLSSGEHVLEYAVSAFVGYWRTTVKINGVVVASSENLTAYNHLTVNFTIELLPPGLDLVPNSGIAATTLVGSAFAPNSEISVTWDDTLIPTVPSPLFTDDYGNFTAIISVLNQTEGEYTVRAFDEMENEANATFTVYSNVSPSSPTISVLSPENKTYNTSDIPLTYTIGEVSGLTYSVDAQTDVTITENTKITGLSDGIHDILIRANDADGNIVASETVWFTVDTTPPSITDVHQLQFEINGTIEGVQVNATVTDAISEVEWVALNYTNGNGSWILSEMTNLESGTWSCTLPAFPHGTNVTYLIVAEDKAENTVTTEELYGELYQYEVLPEFPLWIIMPLFFVASASILVVRKRIALPAFAKISNKLHRLLN